MESEDFSCFTQDDEALFNQIDEDLDLAFALSLQQEFSEESRLGNKQEDFPSSSKSGSNSKPLSIIDAQWELIDPNPDIHGLFLEFNTKFFYGKLDSVEVRWSPRMTLCAGVCCYEGRGRLCSVRLSLPLLKLRPRKDLIETLLHEMIHAYLFVTANNKDHDAHGPEFLKHMYRINKEAGTKISVYHSFHDEVDSYRTHWWKCNGPCQNKRPFYGIVKRAMNRAPGPKDNWWAQHQSTCGGTFTKIKEPDNYKQKNVKRKLQEAKDQKGIKSFFEPSTSKSNASSLFSVPKKHKADNLNAVQALFAKEANIISMNNGTPDLPPLREMNPPVPFAGKGFTLGSSSSEAPRSLLAKLRKDGLLNSKTPSAVPTLEKTQCSQSSNSREEVKKISATDEKESSSSLGNCFKATLSVLEKNKQLKQSSLDQFVSSASRNSETSDASIDGSLSQQSETAKVECPVCSILLPSSEINNHLDQCLLATG